MARATEADFLGEGTADQGTAQPLSLAEQARLEEDARQRRLAENKRARLGRAGGRLGTANQNPGRVENPWEGAPQPGSESGWSEFGASVAPTVKAISKDPITAGILLGPAAITGAGLAVGGAGALGAGLGEGTIAGGSLPAAVPTVTPLGSIASPFGPGSIAASQGGAGAAGAAGAAGSAAKAAPAAADAWTWKDTVRTAAPLVTTGLGAAFEQLIRGGGDDERRRLQEKQEQIAREAQLRRQEQQQARMDALGNRMLAFDPFNQHMARMFGPEAAFQPEQLAALVENPNKPQLDPELMGYRGTDDKKERQINDYMAARDKYNAAEEARRNKVMGGIQRPGPGPAPIQPRTPLPARRY